MMKKTRFNYLLGLMLCTLPLTAADSADNQVYGYVEPLDGAVSFGPKQSRHVTKVFVAEGEDVKAGQILARLECDRENAEYNIVKAKLAVVEADVAMAEDTLRRHEELFSQDVISEHQLTQSRLKRNSALAKLEVAQRELALSELKLRDFDVKAPVDGRLYRFAAREGSVMQGKEPIVIGNPKLGVRMWVNPMKVSACASEHDGVTICLCGESDSVCTGKIIHRSLCVADKNPAAPSTSKSERFQEVVIDLDEDDLSLPIGTPVTGHLQPHA